MEEEFRVLESYGEDLTAKEYVADPAISREEEIRRLIITLLTPEKSGLLVGKAGVGKTAIVEGLAARIQKGDVPDAIKGYRVIKMQSSSLIGKYMQDGQERLIITKLVEELKVTPNIIVFIDEIHTLMKGKNDNPMDLANILKSSLDRGEAKAIGATTSEEYETYIIRDRAFLRRFEKIEVPEPDEATTRKILMGTLPKLEKQMGVHFKYNDYISEQLVEVIVSATSEFKRVYGLAAQYPDVSLSVLTAAFSGALFDNRNEVTLLDVYNAIKTSKRIYPDSIVKELDAFRERFAKLATEENIELPPVSIEEVQRLDEFI